MKRAFVVMAVTTFATLVSACATPKLLRHYDRVDATIHSSTELSLSVFRANPRADEDAALIDELGDRAQAELIRSVAFRLPADSDASALAGALGKATMTRTDACAWADTTSMKKRVTLTVLGNFGRPADRVDRLQFDFSLQDRERAELTSWDKFDSVYGSYDLGSAKYTQSRKLTLGRSNTGTDNLPDSAGDMVKVASVGGEASDSLEENMKYAIRRMSVGGALTPSGATLVQEGGPYINLLGSSSAVFTLKLTPPKEPSPVHRLDFKNKTATAPDDVGVLRCQAKYPDSDNPLRIIVGGKALKRLVVEHHETISEGDDSITFERQAFTPVSTEIASKEDMAVQFYGLASCAQGAEAAQCTRLAIENPHSGEVRDPIALQTPDQAAMLRAWLIVQSKSGKVPATIGTRPIGLVRSPTQGGTALGTTLTPEIVRTLRIMPLAGNTSAVKPSQAPPAPSQTVSNAR